MNKFGAIPFGSFGGKALTPPTFARTGTAYLDGVSYAANTPRFPNTAGTVGVLVEEAATNLVQYSRDYSNAWWSKSQVTVTPNAATAPDGTMTAAAIVDTAVSAGHILSRAAVLTVGQPGTVSVTAKAGAAGWLLIRMSGSLNAWFNLATGAIGTKDASFTCSVEQKAEGFYRCNVSVASVATDGNVTISPVQGNGGFTYAGAGTTAAYLWDTDITAKAYPTTSVPTSGATATRNAETLTVPTNGLLTPSQGSVIIKAYADGDAAAASPVSNRVVFMTRDAGTNGNELTLYRQSGGNTWSIRTSDAAAVATTTNGGVSVAHTVGWHHYGLRYSAAEHSFWEGSTKRLSAASPKLPTAINPTLYLGSHINGSQQWNNGIAWMVFYDRDLSDAEMAQATSGNLPSGYTALVDSRGGALRASSGGASPYYGDQYFQPIALANTGM